MDHGLSFDIECHRQITWERFVRIDLPPDNDVERTTHELLELLAERCVQATFFVVGNVARRFPALIRRIATEGHELGTHGDQHRDVRDLDERCFRHELIRGRGAIEDVVGEKVIGHRAPMFSLTSHSRFAFDALIDLGFLYDSSIFPFSGNRYGDPDAPLGIHRLDVGLYEIPLTVIESGGRRWPALGGGYVRLMPFIYSDWAMRRRERLGMPAVAYFHPCEFSHARLNPSPKEFLGHPRGALRLVWYNMTRLPGRGQPMKDKLVRLLQAYHFVPLRALLPRPDDTRTAVPRQVAGRMRSMGWNDGSDHGAFA